MARRREALYTPAQRRLASFLVAAIIAIWMVSRYDDDPRTFHLSPAVDASAVRAVLRAAGFDEKADARDATLLWADGRLARQAGSGQWVSAFAGASSARPDALCRAMREARRALAASARPCADGADPACRWRAVEIAACAVLPHDRDEVLRTVGAAAGGTAPASAALWLLRPVDTSARRHVAQQGAPPALITNNADALPDPRAGTWTARAYIPHPLLIRGRKATLTVYVCATSLVPLRLYVHTHADLHVASARYDEDLAALDDAARHVTRGSLLRASAGGAVGPRPLSDLWDELGDLERSREAWANIEWAASAGAMALLPPETRRADASPSHPPRRVTGGKFQLSAVEVLLDRRLSAHVIRAWPHAPLPPQLAGVASDALNMSGASLLPARRRARNEMRRDVRLALRSRRRDAKRARHARSAGGWGAWRPPPPPPKPPPPNECDHFVWQPANTSQGRPADGDIGAPPDARRDAPTERCVSDAELDSLGDMEAEWVWRAGFRRLVPGRASPLRRAMRGEAEDDVLLDLVDARWPKAEREWPRAWPPG